MILFPQEMKYISFTLTYIYRFNIIIPQNNKKMEEIFCNCVKIKFERDK